MNNLLKALLSASLLISSCDLLAFKSDDSDDKTHFNSKTFKAMELRNIGPAYMSGRISDIAVDQNNPSFDDQIYRSSDIFHWIVPFSVHCYHLDH